MTDPAFLSAHQLGCKIGTRWLLRDVSLTVRTGEVLAVLGPNGAGKSTLLKLLAGDFPPTEGAVHLNGSPLQRWTSRELAMQRAVVSQESRLAFPFTVWEVVAMGCIGPGRAGGLHQLVHGALDAMHLSPLMSRDYLTLSGGEKKRVHLARALVQLESDVSSRARYLLMDEPVSSLDLKHQHETMTWARRTASSGRVGVMVILHDLSLAAAYADRVVLLRDGRLEACGEPHEVLTSAWVERIFDFALPAPISGSAFMAEVAMV